MTEQQEAPLCLVTGASGYIASHLVKKLLERGFRVRGTVRSLKDPQKTSHLVALFPTLELVEADLLIDGSFDQAVVGVSYVFHTASPFQIVVENPLRDLVEPALNGTKNILSAVKKNALNTIKRVVVTSSVAAVAGKRPEGHVYTEEDWNLESTVDFEPYRYSKRVAEEAAWTWSKETGVSLVVINPSFVLGPPLSSRTDSTSVDVIKGFLEGRFKEKGARNSCFGCVDVRDVAEAHVLAATLPLSGSGEGGRYIVSSERGISHLQMAESLRKSGFEKYPLPDKEEAPVTFVPLMSHQKAKTQLGLQFTDIDVSLRDMANAILDFGLVPRV